MGRVQSDGTVQVLLIKCEPHESVPVVFHLHAMQTADPMLLNSCLGAYDQATLVGRTVSDKTSSPGRSIFLSRTATGLISVLYVPQFLICVFDGSGLQLTSHFVYADTHVLGHTQAEVPGIQFPG